MRRFFLIFVVFLIVSSAGFALAASHGGIDQATGLYIWVKFYREALRTPFFSGFLTVGSFLLTLQTTILSRIKEIYDSPEYEKRWEQHQEQRRTANRQAKQTPFYGPLRNLGLALIGNV